MYARNYGEEENVQTFRRGQYSIPANYAGNAFTADEEPIIVDSVNETAKPTSETANHREVGDIPDSAVSVRAEPDHALAHAEVPSHMRHPQDGCASHPPQKCDECEQSHGGLLRGLLSRFERGFELDDWLLIGLIILLLHSDKNECDSSRDEIIVLLALLLLFGF